MTSVNQVFRCNICGNIIEILNAGEGRLVCCDQPMELLIARKTDVGPEKHIPVIEELEYGIKIRIGDVEHPMEEKHYIQWLEILLDDKVLRKNFKPGEKPETTFKGDFKGDFMVRAYCNIHGLWY